MHLDHIPTIFRYHVIQHTSTTFNQQVAPGSIRNNHHRIELGINSTCRTIDDDSLSFATREHVMVDRTIGHHRVADGIDCQFHRGRQ